MLKRIIWIFLLLAVLAFSYQAILERDHFGEQNRIKEERILKDKASDEAATSCSDPVYQQFDFWLGDWEVYTPDGKLAGTNQITKEYGDCVLRERYATPYGYRGESLNTYDTTRKQWHQTWVDNSGLLLLLNGELVNGSMVLQSESKDGAAIKHRITWTPNSDGSVRQLWESTDASGNWQVAFDGRYVRKALPEHE